MFQLFSLIRGPEDGAFHVHFSGICGTAMAGVAAELKKFGLKVSGSDQDAYPPTAPYLEQRGISVAAGYAAENLEPAPDLVVIGNALSRGNPEVEAVLDRGLAYCSLAELIRWAFLPEKRPLVVTGTHGKTTTAALCAWILREGGADPSWLVGGVPLGLEEGFHCGGGEIFVLEGDEYDTAFFDKRSKFIHYRPRVLILNNLEYDHADIFADLEAVRTSFRHLLRTVPRTGLVVANADDSEVARLAEDAPCPVVRYSLSDPGVEWFGQNRAGSLMVRDPWGGTHQVDHRLIGAHQGWNLLAALAGTAAAGTELDPAVEALVSFPGVRRRGELRGEVRGVRVYDDFAHHPTAVRGTLAGFRERFPAQRIWAVLEPRSNTMRRGLFQRELVEALGAADAVCIRHVPDPGKAPAGDRLDVDRVAADCTARGTDAWALPNAAAIVTHLGSRLGSGDVVVILSNGGFEDIHRRLLERLGERRGGPEG